MVFALLLAQTGVNGIACALIDKAEATTRQCLPTLEMPDHLLFIGKNLRKILLELRSTTATIYHAVEPLEISHELKYSANERVAKRLKAINPPHLLASRFIFC